MSICILIWLLLLTPSISLSDDLKYYCPNGICQKYRNNKEFKEFSAANIENIDVQNILSQAQRNWKAPSAYLQKRGYLTGNLPHESALQRKRNYDNIDSLKRFLNYPASNEMKTSCSYGNCHASFEGGTGFSHMSFSGLENAGDGADKKPGIMTKLKNKFDRLFQTENKTPSKKGSSVSLGDLNKKIDDSSEINVLLRNLTRPDIDYIKSFIKCFKENKSKFSIDYIRKNQTFVNIATKPPTTVASIAQTITSANRTKTTRLPYISLSRTMKPLVPAVSTSLETSSVSPVEKDENVNLDIEIKANATCSPLPTSSSASGKKTLNETSHIPDISVEESKTNDISSTIETFSTLLKFLAHTHHAVDEVGKPPHKPLNFNKIQAMIDSAHEILDARALIGDDDNDTDCTPIQLNKVDLELEWTSGNEKSNKKTESSLTQDLYGGVPLNEVNTKDVDSKEVDSILSEFLSGSPEAPNVPMVPPYSDNYLMANYDDLNEGKNPAQYILIKRNAQYDSAENSNPDTKVDTVADSTFERYLDDYSFQNSRENKNTDTGNNKIPYMSDDSSDFFGFGKKKKKHKRKRKKKKKHDHKTPCLTGNCNLQKQIDPDNPFQVYPEVADLELRIRPDQQESLDKFVKNLHDPPEIFQFDVNQFVKPIMEVPRVELETNPPKTFYEFLPAPAIENESVPIILPGLEQELITEAPSIPVLEDWKGGLGKRDAGQEVSNDDGLHNRESGQFDAKSNVKRDLLRQYMKGVSQYMNALPKPIESTIKKSVPVGFDDGEPGESDEDSLGTNYTNELEAPKRDLAEVRNELPDEFIDNFYLLNDGSSSAFDTDKMKNAKLEKTCKDPVSLELDLELNEKFKDLNYVDSMRKAAGRDTKNIADMNDVEFVIRRK